MKTYYLYINNVQVSFLGLQASPQVLRRLLKQHQQLNPGKKCEYRTK